MRAPLSHLLAIASAVALVAVQPVAAQAETNATLFHHVRVFDGGKITAIGARIAAPSGATIVDGTGATLLPGLIDSHTHAFGDALDQALAFGVRLDRKPVPVARATTVSSRDSVVGMISNFDDGTTRTSMGMGWVASTDQIAGGQSTATMKVVDGGANGTAKSLETTGNVAPGLPYAWAGPMFMPGAQAMSPVNLSAAKALHFWTKGDGKTYHVMVFAQSKGQLPLSVDFVAGPDWKEYTFPFTAFDGIDGHDIMGIAFVAGPQPGPFSLRIDEVSFK